MRSQALVAALPLVVALSTVGGHASAQNLLLHVENGVVTLDAENVSVAAVLARWTELTGLKVVSKGGEGTEVPVTLHLAGVSEREALATLMQDLSGYIMGERRDPDTGIVTIDRLMILSRSVPTAAQTPAGESAPFPTEGPLASRPRPPAGAFEDSQLATEPEVDEAVAGAQANQLPSGLANPFAQTPPPDRAAATGVISESSVPGLANMPSPTPGASVPPSTPSPNQGSAQPSTPFGPVGLSRPGEIAPVPPPAGTGNALSPSLQPPAQK